MPPKRASVAAKHSAKRQTAKRATAVAKARSSRKTRVHMWEDEMARKPDGTLHTRFNVTTLPPHRDRPRKTFRSKGVLDAGKDQNRSTMFGGRAHTGPRRPAADPKADTYLRATRRRDNPAPPHAEKPDIQTQAAHHAYQASLAPASRRTNRAPKSAEVRAKRAAAKAKKPVKRLPGPKK